MSDFNKDKAGHENDQPKSHKDTFNDTEDNTVDAEMADEDLTIDPEDTEAAADATEDQDDAFITEAEDIANGATDEDAPEEPAAEGETNTDYKEDLQRLQAEYVNYRKRVERDRAVAGDVATQKVLEGLLPVLDDIDAAREHGDLEGTPFASISQKLNDTVERSGMERYGETGVPFDPMIHEALIQQPSDEVTEETVTQVLRTGYKMGDKVVRAAQVIVSVPEN